MFYVIVIAVKNTLYPNQKQNGYIVENLYYYYNHHRYYYL